MTAKAFVSQLRQAVVEENVALYKQLFTDTSAATASDPYWKRALEFFDNLDSAQQSTLFEIIRQVAVDTTSNVLGIIDGVSTLEGFDDYFKLNYGGETQLNGDLQSLFLVEEERALLK
jgi:predicted RNA polymerase sigma factor